MNGRLDRRVVFFLVASVACFLLVPLSDDDLRWVAWGTGAVYVLLALVSGLDARSRRRR